LSPSSDPKLDSLIKERNSVVADHAQFIGRHDNVRLSFWSFSMYRECPQKYIMAAVGRRKPVKKDNFHAITGSVVHSLWEDFTKGVKSGTFCWDDRDFFRGHVQPYYDRFVESNWVDWPTQRVDPTDFRTHALPLIQRSVDNAYEMLSAQGLIPHPPELVHPEFSFVTPHAGGAIQLSGRTDLIFEYDDSIKIVDYKDVKDASKINWRQTVWYTFGLEPLFKKPVAEAGYLLTKLNEWAWRNPNGKARNDSQGRSYREVLWAEILDVVTKIRRERFEARVSRFHCNYCPVKDACPEYWTYAGKQQSLFASLSGLGEGDASF
jgi:hypothetical protein